MQQYEKTKNIIIELTLHMEKVEGLYKKVEKEIEKITGNYKAKFNSYKLAIIMKKNTNTQPMKSL